MYSVQTSGGVGYGYFNNSQNDIFPAVQFITDLLRTITFYLFFCGKQLYEPYKFSGLSYIDRVGFKVPLVILGMNEKMYGSLLLFFK